MGGYLASREVLTAADRRQTNYATKQAGDIQQMCVSPNLIPVMSVRPFSSPCAKLFPR